MMLWVSVGSAECDESCRPFDSHDIAVCALSRVKMELGPMSGRVVGTALTECSNDRYGRHRDRADADERGY